MEKESFGKSLGAIRLRRGYSQEIAAGIVSKSRRTIIWWETEQRTPDEATQKGVLRLLRESKAPPSEAKREELKDTHHMHWEAERGWTVRFTLVLHKKQVGKRIKVRLRTYEMEEAVKRRDLLIGCFENLGFQIAKRVKKNARSMATPACAPNFNQTAGSPSPLPPCSSLPE